MKARYKYYKIETINSKVCVRFNPKGKINIIEIFNDNRGFMVRDFHRVETLPDKLQDKLMNVKRSCNVKVWEQFKNDVFVRAFMNLYSIRSVYKVK